MSQQGKRNAIIARLLHWHPRIGMVVGLAIIAWGLSGLSHPIISRIQPSAAMFEYKLETLSTSGLISIAQATEQAGISAPLTHARLMSWQQRPVYRLQTAKQVFWLDARSGEAIIHGEEDYAIQLARHFMADQDSELASLRLQTEFDEDYVYVNRLLPVWRVEFARDDGMRVYVDTQSDRLATVVNNTKAMASGFFRNLHSWIFIKNTTLRLSLMSICLLGGSLIAIFGLWQFFLQWRAGRGWRKGRMMLRVHRWLGVSVAITALTFSGSGLLHLWQKQFVATPLLSLKVLVAPADLSIDWSEVSTNLVQADLVAIGRQSYFRVWHHGSLHYYHGTSGEELVDGETLHVRQLAAEYFPIKADINNLRKVTEFGGEYGFVNKRLPVYAVDYDDEHHTSVYIELRSGQLAAIVRDADRIEGLSFSVLHKWHFADRLGRTARDALSALFAAGIVVVFAVGMMLTIRRARRSGL